jgi:hypothetical protein
MQLVAWWYDWGVFLFAFIDLLIVVWVLYDSSVRNIPSAGWRLGTIAPTLLLIPAMMFRFAGPATQVNLANLAEPFFWVGLVGGLIPIIVGVGYVLSITGSRAEPQVVPPQPQVVRPQPQVARAEPSAREARTRVGDAAPRVAAAPRAAKAAALLYMEVGSRAGTDYRLNVGTTAIGRASDNDVVLDDDTASRQHALIREDRGHFTLQDRGSLDGTLLNGEKIRGSVTLQDGDEIGLGNTVLRFKIL